MKLPLLTLTASLALGLTLAWSAEPRAKATPDPTTPAEKKSPRSPNGRPLPYKVKITAIDEPAASFSSAGKGGTTNVFVVTEKTTMTKDGKPATFGDLAVGSLVTGSRSRTLGGKWEVASVNIQGIDAAPKPRGTKKETAAKPAEKKPAETPSPAQTEITPAPAPAPGETAKPAEAKPDAKPEEKKAE